MSRNLKGGIEIATIAAIATPLGEGGVGMIRLSGPDSLKILGKVWSGETAPSRFKSHHLYHGWMRDPATERRIDETLICWMQAPHSYTGEDVVEISAHGSPLVLKKILALLLACGARPAEPGEFTKRAFLNGRIDLTQAESVAAMIGAKSETALRLAERGLAGALKEKISALRQALVETLSRLEASIDFPEEDLEIEESHREVEALHHVQRQIGKLLADYEEGKAFREGVTVSIVGRPNVGKSSLLNCLVGRDRAIVHPEPGTTRDTVEGELKLGGILFRLVDTAGLRETVGAVEKEGVARARRALAEGDLALIVLDRSEPLSDTDQELLALARGKKSVVVLNKCDLPSHPYPSTDDKKGSGVFSDLFSNLGKEVGKDSRPLFLSALTGEGIPSLKETIVNLVVSGKVPTDETGIFNVRHRNHLTKGDEALSAAIGSLQKGEPPEFASSLVRQATTHLAEITGEVTTEEILGEIFSKFCIGK